MNNLEFGNKPPYFTYSGGIASNINVEPLWYTITRNVQLMRRESVAYGIE